MTDGLVAQVLVGVQHYLRNRSCIWLRSEFGFLVNSVASSCNLNPADPELWMVVAMCAIGPSTCSAVTIDHPGLFPSRLLGTTEIPPKHLRDKLLEIVRGYQDRGTCNLNFVFDLVVAFGGGKWRESLTKQDAWGGKWHGAVTTIAAMMMPGVSRANTWLEEHIVDCPSRKADHSRDDAHLIAHHFVNPTINLQVTQQNPLVFRCTGNDPIISICSREYSVPTGSKIVFSSRQPFTVTMPEMRTMTINERQRLVVASRENDLHFMPNGQQAGGVHLSKEESARISMDTSIDIWACRCGWVQCEHRHRLDAWNPQHVDHTLAMFVDFAVTSPNGILHTNSFIYSMYFPLLATLGFGP